jgi:hypothetical protein
MFKFFFRVKHPTSRLYPGLLLLLVPLLGCKLLPPLPPANLQQPGWTVHQGQVVWRLGRGSKEIAGDFMVATKSDGASFVQFTKPPFPFLIGRQTPTQWQVEIPPQDKRYSGHGKPPKRLIWLWLPRALSGQAPPRNWVWSQEGSTWNLTNGKSGESLEGYFEQ